MAFKFGKKQPHNEAATTHKSNKGGLAKLAGGLPILLLALAAWAVALAGVSIVRHEVGENGLVDANGFVVYPVLDFTWFVVFFNLFVLLCCAIHLIGAGIGGRFMPLGASAVAGLLAVATVLTIFETRDWNNVRKLAGRDTKAGKGATTLFAGYISLAVLDGLLILILGNQHDSRRSATTTTTTYHTHPEAAFPTTTPVTHNPTGMAHATTTAAPHQGVNVV